jgi:ATP-grasp domain/L-amino acid ligase C-terminal domain 2/ATP-grasp N-terminal domain
MLFLFTTTTGYQTRSFLEAARRRGIDVALATDRCPVLEDPWRDGAVPVRFHDEDGSLVHVLEAAEGRRVDGVLAIGDRPTTLAARSAGALGLVWHPREAAEVSRNKLAWRQRQRDAGLPHPWFIAAPAHSIPGDLIPAVSFPCVVKPLVLSGSRGVIRADDPASLGVALQRVRRLLMSDEVRALRDPAAETVLIEGFLPGIEVALEGLMTHGVFRTLAVFDKPDPLDGPFFEESIYVTPSRLDEPVKAAVDDAVTRAVAAMGLCHGPIHAECRVNAGRVTVLEVAARPIGGLCARALRFVPADIPEPQTPGNMASLEELLLMHAGGTDVAGWRREVSAVALMMIPIPAGGILRGVDGVDEATRVTGVDEIRITAKIDQMLTPLPEGATYLGFIFARAATPADAEAAVRNAHGRLRIRMDRPIPVVQRGE